MSDQEATSTSQPSSDERQQQQQQQRTNQPERERTSQQERGGGTGAGGHRDRGRRRHSQNQPPQQSPQQPRRAAEPSLNLEELRELVELIAQYGFTDFELEREGIRVRLRRELAPQASASGDAQSALQSQSSARVAPPVASTAAATQNSAPAATTAPAPPPTPQASAEAAKAAAPEEELHLITSPIVGTFYRSPSSTAEPFVRLGSHVSGDTVVCIIEAMKLMNEIQAETSGEIVKIYVENGQPVEYGQPLFGIKK
jgi:acetyl-CoA carboxylase biotin carboxyl carrier protein